MANTPSKSPAENYHWCLHCERTFPKAEEDVYLCPLDGCDGGPGDIWEWSEVRMEKGVARYPEVPVDGVEYPLYDTKKK